MKKAERISRVKNSLTERELNRKLPEVNLIRDEEIREGTKNTFLLACPDGFWEKASSSTGKYHEEDERGKYGNWLHTNRVFVTYLIMSQTYIKQGLITEDDREGGKSAALLHDMLKYGWPSENREHTSSRHDVINSDVARIIGGLPPSVYNPIHAHNGAWSEGKTPQNDREEIMHLSDYVAAKPILGKVAVWNPARELKKAFPDLPELSDNDLEKILS